jgi:hypothetical protein
MHGAELPKRQAILFLCHTTDPASLERHGKLAHEAGQDFDVYFCFDAESALVNKRRLRNVGKTVSFTHHDWKKIKRSSRYCPTFVPGNEDGTILAIVQRLPAYEFIWAIEYDVAYSGHWMTFFRDFDGNRSDLLATSIVRYKTIPNWPLWKSLEVPEGVVLSDDAKLRSFDPCLRISRRAVELLIAEYRKGWAGNSECVMPTVLQLAGGVIEDIGGDGEFTPEERRNRHYRSTATNSGLAPGTFIFRPTFSKPGDEPNTLWHPVKDPALRSWEALERHKGGIGARIRTRFSRLWRSALVEPD